METKRKPISIPVVSAEQPADDSPFGAGSGAEPFALMVLVVDVVRAWRGP